MTRLLARLLLCALLFSAGVVEARTPHRLSGAESTTGGPVGPALGTGATVLYLPVVMKPDPVSSTWEQEYHVPYSVSSTGGVRLPEMAVFWLGQVDLTRNYADVRLAFNDHSLYVDVAVIDRLLWHDSTPAPSDLIEYDAVSLYLHLADPAGASPGTQSYRLRAQASPAIQNYQSAERGTGSGWVAASVPFTTTALWRGDGFNNSNQDHGWAVQFQIPFASLGQGGRPADGTRWALGVTLHDRDDAAGTAIADTPWPPALAAGDPSSWGAISFGLPLYQPPPGPVLGSVTLREGQNGVSVPDASVGGHTTCGYQGFNMWTEWGTRVWSVDGLNEFVNVQNQRDVSDWPCFSKYYLSFPLAGHVPSGQAVLSATLTLHLTGGSGGPTPPPQRSLIQVLTVNSAWDVNSIHWNNAPLAWENVSQTSVEPAPAFPGWPGIPYVWDLSYAVARAVASGQSELRLALYSADAAIHSGKYFASSDTDDFTLVSRPTLAIAWGNP